MPNLPTPAQIRGARGMLDWSILDLAKAASVSVSTIKRVEADDYQLASDGSYFMIQAAFEAAGMSFLEKNSQGIGLRMRQG